MRIIYLKKEKEKKKIQKKHQIFFEYNILQLLYSSCTSLNLYDNRGNRSIRDRPIFLSSRQPMIYCPSPKSFIHQCPRRTNREGRGEAKASERASERARAREREIETERDRAIDRNLSILGLVVVIISWWSVSEPCFLVPTRISRKISLETRSVKNLFYRSVFRTP